MLSKLPTGLSGEECPGGTYISIAEGEGFAHRRRKIFPAGYWERSFGLPGGALRW